MGTSTLYVAGLLSIIPIGFDQSPLIHPAFEPTIRIMLRIRILKVKGCKVQAAKECVGWTWSQLIMPKRCRVRLERCSYCGGGDGCRYLRSFHAALNVQS
jgi:hypothetical protein